MPTDSRNVDLAPGISDEAFEEAKDIIGTELRLNKEGVRRRHNWNREATIDTIRHFTHGYGDTNPLYNDPEYAKETEWGRMVAPPTWLYTVDKTVVAPKFPGLQWIYGGTRFEFERPVFRGDRFTVTVTPTKVEKKEGKTVDEFVLQEGEVEYYDETDELVATATGRTLRIPRPQESDDETSIHQEREETVWSDEELEALEERIIEQSRRGDETRYWDTVSEGDELEPRIKGPLAFVDILCWYLGYGGSSYFAHEEYVQERSNHPAEAFRRENGVIEHPGMGHLDPTIARGVGVPRPYDIAHQRVTWLVQTVTDWMSDAGFVKTVDINTEKLNYLGDLTETSGRVVEKWIDEETGEHLLEISLKGVNQLDQRNVRGTVTIRLPHSTEDCEEYIRSITSTSR